MLHISLLFFSILLIYKYVSNAETFSTKLQEGYLVYECNDKCRCDKTCPNRILQNGIRIKLEVFKTEKKVTTIFVLINSK